MNTVFLLSDEKQKNATDVMVYDRSPASYFPTSDSENHAPGIPYPPRVGARNRSFLQNYYFLLDLGISFMKRTHYSSIHILLFKYLFYSKHWGYQRRDSLL